MHFAIDYLANPDAYDLGDRVAVIGVGNSAMDVARTVIRKGSPPCDPLRQGKPFGRQPS